jgi:ParB/RepB/Spo0J family partition protein
MPETKVDENLIFEMNPIEIVVSDDRPRQRKELRKIEDMANSITKFGQILPIVIGRDKSLIAGGRRLAACLILGRKARVVYRDTVDTLLMQEMELEENLQRESLTPAEEVVAIKTLHELKQKIYGASVSGREGGHTLNDTADAVGKTRGNVIEAIKLAEMIEQFPNLAECKTKSEIKSAVKGLQRTVDNMVALHSYEETIKQTKEFVLVNRDCKDWLKGMGDKSVDLFFTDPPYGIDIHENAMTIGGQTGGERTTTNTRYDDSERNAKELLTVFAKESFRITKDTGHVMLFCAPSHFWWLKELMAAAGWLVAPRPTVWIKRESGQNNQPEHWFSSAYEFILFGRKQESKLVLQGRPDWIQCDPVLPSIRTHQAEKPVDLCKELISRTCLPGGYLIDPCMGSGALIEAGVKMKMLCLGCEKEVENYAGAVSRMAKLKEVK